MFYLLTASLKKIILFFWKLGLFFHILITVYLPKTKTSIKVFFGGARKGDFGGPLVKIKRLCKHFNENFCFYNIVYLISNASYFKLFSLKLIRSKNIPIILNQNGVFYPGWYKKDFNKKNKEMSHAYHLANYVFWQSNFCKKSADIFLGERTGPGEILFNAVDLNIFKPKIKKNKKKFIFLITGKINNSLKYRVTSAIKGLNYAIKKGLSAELLIAGVIERSAMKDISKMIIHYKLENKIKYIGPYNQKDAPKIYQKANAYIMLKYLDPCPNTVIEAMACGLPILYSNSGGLPELVDKKCGVGLPVDEDWNIDHKVPSTEEIGKGMIEIYDKCDIMGKNSRIAAIRKFDLTKWIERHKFIFDKYLEK